MLGSPGVCVGITRRHRARDVVGPRRFCYDKFIFGIELWPDALDDALDECYRRAHARAGGYACFVNVHTLTESTANAPLREALQQATFRFPDGLPLVWFSRVQGEPLAERVCGPDFMDRLLRRATNIDHGFIGGTEAGTQLLVERYGVNAVIYNPPMRAFSPSHALEDWQRFLEKCAGRPPSIVWVGLGAPKQERWMQTVHMHAPEVMFLGVGAAFDFLSGVKSRAPRWMQVSGLEWAHRLASDPRRLWRRYVTTNSKFAVLCARELMNR